MLSILLLTCVLVHGGYCQLKGFKGNVNEMDMSKIMFERFEEMESKIYKMQDRIDHLEEREEKHVAELRTIYEINRELEKRVETLEQEKLRQDAVNGQERTDRHQAEPVMRQYVSGSKDQTQDRPSRLVLGQTEGPVAFSAILNAIKSEGHLGVNQNIIYDKLLTDIGGGFHMAQGTFIVPQSGIYLLSSTVMTYINVEVRAAITVNGKHVAHMFGHGTEGRHEQGTQVIVMQLNQGDDVSVQNVDLTDTSIWGDQYTSFSGILLMNM